MPVVDRPTRLAAAITTALLLLLPLQSCGGDDKTSSQPTGTPSDSETTTEPTTTEPTTTSPTPDPNAWRDQYTADQLAAYDQALQRFDDYEQRSEPIWAAGKATPAAEALFKQYFPSPLWSTYYQQLQTYEASDVEVNGLPTVLTSKATAIGSDARTVTIEQCVDLTTSRVTQNGIPGTPVMALTKPVIRTVQLDKPDGYNWLLYRIRNPTAKKYVRCGGSQS